MAAESQKLHFGVLSFTGAGHLYAMIALGLELQERGHQVTFFEKPKIEQRIRGAGLNFYAIGSRESPFKGKEASPASAGGVVAEWKTLRFNLRRIEHDLDSYFRETELALRERRVDALIVNEIAVTGPTLAELLGLPYFIISTSVPHNFGWNTFPTFSGYRYRRSWSSEISAAILQVSAVKMHGPIRRVVNRYRAKRGLGPVRGINPSYLPLAQITQLPQSLDLPQKSLPTRFHYTGPFKREGVRPKINFPWDRLDGRPIIYASLGTTRNAQAKVLRLIADACEGLDAQLVISLGGRFELGMFRSWTRNAVIVEFAPQLEILKRASMVVTHAGPNTAFECLMEGKPMVAIPLAYDQPAIAARLQRLGLAEVLPVMRLSAQMIREGVVKVLTNPSYRQAAEGMRDELRKLDGTRMAIDVVEEALRHEVDKKAAVGEFDGSRTLMPAMTSSGGR